ncbi:MAG: ubiquinol-cytochrome c reductase iron-sulfur subunit [Gammaproteobacteria bacterium]|nr:ubiquinol-cytochrome c reductase iron-sulfur subunit [Gammaproteobacteria bacterium]
MSETVGGADEPGVDHSRRKFLTVATSATAAVGAVFAATPFVASWQPSERARAMGAPVEFDFARLEPGQMVTLVWRKQPIYVVRRTEASVKALAAHDAELKDPESVASLQPAYAKNEFRARRPDLLVIVATCTHLGCLPKQHFEPGDAALGADWPGGFFCPCPGSKFDLAGRVMNGSPASTNLVVPPYMFRNDHLLVIGLNDDAQGAA